MAKLIHVAVYSMLAGSLILNAAGDKLTIMAYPQFVQANGAIRITCHVPRQPDNRQLLYGIKDYAESARDLEGEDSRVTWETMVEHIPCGSEQAYCAVVRSDSTQEVAVARVTVIGCEDR